MTALCVETTNGHSADIPLRPRPGVPCQSFLQDRQRNHLIFWNSFFVRPVLEYLSRVNSDLLEQTNEYFCLLQLWHRARATWPPTSFLIRWRRLANELRYVTTYSSHWDQHLLSRATLLPDGFCLACNICAFCVGYASTHHSISYFTTMSHFPSYFCFVFLFFLPTYFSESCLFHFFAFISMYSNFRVLLFLISLLHMHINSHCPRRPIQEGEVCLWRNSHLFIGVYIFSFFFSLLLPLLE